MNFKDIEKLEQTEDGMRFREDIPNPNGKSVTYKYKDIVILSPINAYVAFIKFLDKIYDQDGDIELGELIPQLYFNNHNDTNYARSWRLWEESVMELLKEEYEESQEKEDNKSQQEKK